MDSIYEDIFLLSVKYEVLVREIEKASRDSTGTWIGNMSTLGLGDEKREKTNYLSHTITMRTTFKRIQMYRV